MKDKDFGSALNYAFLLLKYRARSTTEIATRLKRKGFPDTAIGQVISYLKDHKYLNDEEFVSVFVRYGIEKGWGPRRIEFSLRRLGIAAEACQSALEGIGHTQQLRELIVHKVSRYRAKGLNEAQVRQKVLRSLLARGFLYEDILQEMDRASLDTHED